MTIVLVQLMSLIRNDVKKKGCYSKPGDLRKICMDYHWEKNLIDHLMKKEDDAF